MALSVICPFQNHHSTIPYSAGGVKKLAAAWRADGTVICCQGRSAATAENASRTVANRSRMAYLRVTFGIGKSA